MLLTELSVFKMSIQFFGKAFLRILNSDIQLDLFFNYFITCTFLKEFWTKFQNLMKGLGIENKITLNHIVLGYKIDDKNYLALNIFIGKYFINIDILCFLFRYIVRFVDGKPYNCYQKI
jgi:hypothetical protein